MDHGSRAGEQREQGIVCSGSIGGMQIIVYHVHNDLT